jgi:4-alpha-glucanotransferase
MRNLAQTFRPDFLPRSSGILLHATSLPGPHGCGDLGAEAHLFLEFLAECGQSWWQMLPIGPPGRAPDWSPYDLASAFAGSPWLVSLSTLAHDGLLELQALKPTTALSKSRMNFAATRIFREGQLRRAFDGFRRRQGERQRDYREFCEANADWLEDFALFMALRSDSGGKPWTDWDPSIRRREPTALRAAGERLADEVAAHRFVQFEFDRQWRGLREHARRLGIGLIGDLPIFVAQDSADVWSHPELFQLDRNGQPQRVSGYPPDRFNRNGQRWGHPQYRWAAHEQTGFAWWVRRFERIFELFDTVRIDHFLGFNRTWSISADSKGARSGRWVKSPGFELFAAVERKIGRRPMIAEDLGHVTPADVRLRDSFGLAPMRIFQFGFGTEADSDDHLPHNYSRLCAAYPGNHDNDTTVGWFHGLPASKRRRVQAYTGGQSATIHRDSLRVLFASPASLVISPLQDVLGLDSPARMNVPGTVEGNWSWRLASLPSAATVKALRSLTEMFGRAPVARHPEKIQSSLTPSSPR